MWGEKEFLETVEAVCKHSGLYTPTGSFFEGVSFLEGFGIGANVGGGEYHSKLTPFCKWLVTKFESKKLIIHWNEFRERFSSDLEAFENLSVLYKEYIESVDDK
jgi:hypothetical protein